MLFIIALKTLFKKVKSGYLELLYAYNLALHSETLEGLIGKLEGWEGALESRGLRVNVKKDLKK